jgi:hypothetical protein
VFQRGDWLSEAEYSAWRKRQAAVFALRVACALAVIWFWDDLDSILKVAALVVVAIAVPKLTSVRRLLVPYDQYLKQGLPD